jgi:predicted nucleic acid-binding protein
VPDTFVVDCSVAAKWVLPEPDRDSAIRWLERWESGEITLIAPDLLLAEFASLLAKRSRRKQLSVAQAKQGFRLMLRCAPSLYDTRPRLALALDISLQHHLSLWDSVYVALALEHDCSLLTADRRLARSGATRHPVIRLLGYSDHT